MLLRNTLIGVISFSVVLGIVSQVHKELTMTPCEKLGRESFNAMMDARRQASSGGEVGQIAARSMTRANALNYSIKAAELGCDD